MSIKNLIHNILSTWHLRLVAWLLWLFFIIVCLLELASCRTSQPTYTSVARFSAVADTVRITHTLPVADTLRLPLPQLHTGVPACDSLCQQQLDALLADLRVAKKSGQSSYSFYYDAYQRQLVLTQQLAAQLSTQEKSVHSQSLQNKETSVQRVPYTPIYMLVLAMIGASNIGYFIFRLFIFFKFPKLL